MLGWARPDAEIIFAGKRPGEKTFSQDEINALLIEKTRLGKNVVRLKGGDPFVFGRGGEEALALQRAGIRFEIVPGVTSAISAPALAGIPVTHRGLSPGFAVITASHLPALESIAPGQLTLVILMGIGARRPIADRLIDRGWDPSTPAAIVMGAGTPGMSTWRGRIDELPAAAIANPSAPGTIVVGDVAALPIDVSNGHSISQEIAR